jgi:hypothetical protein
MSIVTNSPFDSDDDLFPDGGDYFPSHSDSGTHDWDSQHHDYDHSHFDHTHHWNDHEHQWDGHSFDHNHDDSYLLNDLIHQGDDLQHTSDSDDVHSDMLGDASDHTGYWVHQNFDPAHSDGIVVGDPGHDLHCWHHQNRPDDCAVVAQQSVLESLTGKHFSEDGLCREALADGCYHPGGGTPGDHVGHVLEEHGIPIEHHYGGTVLDLSEKLSHGEKVIVAVNSHEIWMPDKGSILSQTLGEYTGIPGQRPDHAVVVTGIVYPKSDPLHPQVVLNDSGTSSGRGMMVPLEQFEKAWAASDHYMVATAVHGKSGVSENFGYSFSPNVHNAGVIQQAHDLKENNSRDESHNFMLGETHYHHHYHHIVKRTPDFSSHGDPGTSSSSSDSSSSSYDSNYDDSYSDSGCVDSDGDGKCDASGGDGGDGGDGGCGD